jgi:hypothetical protein
MHHPSFFHVALAGIVFCGLCGLAVMLLAMFRAKPDPNEMEEFNEQDIYSKPTLRKVK